MMVESTDRTDQQLLRTAIDLFGRYGYDSVTTRMLADAAGTNVSSIKYHYGSKDDLYIAAIDQLVGFMQPRVAMMQALARQGLELAAGDPARLAALVRQTLHAAVSAFLESPELRQFLPFVLRELLMPGPHFDRLYDAIPRRLHELLTELVAAAEQRPVDDPVTITRAHALVGQLVVFHVGRAILLRRLATDDYDAAQVARIRNEVADLAVRALGLPPEGPRHDA